MAFANRVSCSVNGPPLGHAQPVARPEPADDERARIVGGLDRQPAVGGRGQDGLALERGALEELLQRSLQEPVVQRADGKRRRQGGHGAPYDSASDATRDADRLLRRPGRRARRIPRVRQRFPQLRLHLRRRRAAARAFAARLHAAGLRKGDAVLFWSENRPEWIVALWGCLLQGVVAVPIDYRASADFLQRVRAS